jgi:PAS domain S-box-containing protein
MLAEHVGPYLEQVHLSGEALLQQEVDIDLSSYLLSYFPIAVDGSKRYGRMVIDVTGQRRAEEQYQQLIEQLPLVTYVHTLVPGLKSTYVSPQIEELYGYPVADWLDDPELWRRVVHPDDFETVAAAERTARELGEPFELEYRIVRADGTIRWVLDLMNTVRDADAKPLFEQGFLVDVTERKESENLFRAVFDGAFEAMVISDDDGRCVDVNPAACDVFGQPRAELIGLELEAVSVAVPASGVVSGFCEIVRPDGSVRELELSARANVLPGVHIEVLRDVTDRRQLERDLWRAQRLESVGRLAGGVAQDFNNLLTAIRGYAQLLLAQVAPGSVQHHHAEEIDLAADRAAVLTAQLLAFARRQVLQARPTELNRLVENLEGMLQRLVGDGVELAFELEPGLLPVRIDPAQIEQVLVNLVANAADVTPTGSRVVVGTTNAEVRALADVADGRYAVLSVIDAGPGIDESALEHLFEPFFTTKDVGQGIGLGLATAYGIARQSGGTIVVTTAAGVGSTFAVYLPEASDVRSDDSPAEGAGEIVVVVESDPAVRDVVFEVLSDAGYHVVTAATPTEAQRLAEQLGGPIDLVVTELDALRAQALRTALDAGATLTLQKPYSPVRLRQAVRSTLDAPKG